MPENRTRRGTARLRPWLWTPTFCDAALFGEVPSPRIETPEFVMYKLDVMDPRRRRSLHVVTACHPRRMPVGVPPIRRESDRHSDNVAADGAGRGRSRRLWCQPRPVPSIRLRKGGSSRTSSGNGSPPRLATLRGIRNEKRKHRRGHYQQAAWPPASSASRCRNSTSQPSLCGGSKGTTHRVSTVFRAVSAVLRICQPVCDQPWGMAIPGDPVGSAG